MSDDEFMSDYEIRKTLRLLQTMTDDDYRNFQIDIMEALHQRIMELEQKVKQAEDKAVFKAIFKPGAQPD